MLRSIREPLHNGAGERSYRASSRLATSMGYALRYILVLTQVSLAQVILLHFTRWAIASATNDPAFWAWMLLILTNASTLIGVTALAILKKEI